MNMDSITAYMQMPTRVYHDQTERRTPYGTVSSADISLEPLNRGFGHTIGNSLRRILLSSIPGSAVCAAEIEGVSHELETLVGVQEDVLNILLNLKQLPVRLIEGRDSAVLDLDVKGPGCVRASDLSGYGVELLDPELEIAHLGQNGHLKMRVYVKQGFGYVPVEEQEFDVFGDTLPTGLLKMDSIYSPVKNVIYHVQGSRVHQRTDFDKLVLHIETNGSVEPQEALRMATYIMHCQLEVFGDLEKHLTHEHDASTESTESQQLKGKISELDLGVRALNCLQNMNIETIGELIAYSEKELLRTPNLGRKSLDEIKLLLSNRSLSLRND